MSEDQQNVMVDAIGKTVKHCSNRNVGTMIILAVFFGGWMTRQTMQSNQQSLDITSLRQEMVERRGVRDAQIKELQMWLAEQNKKIEVQDREIGVLGATIASRMK